MLLVGGVVLVAGLVGLGVRQMRPAKPGTVADVVGIDFPAVVFFGSADCVSCRPARSALVNAGVPFTELTWERNSEMFERLEIAEVPTTWVIDRVGQIRANIIGTPSGRELRKAKLQLPRK